MTQVLHRSLPHVLWIAGPAGAGKTTVARRLARKHGLRWYNSDAHTWQHLDRAVARAVRNAQRFAALTPAQRRAAQPEDIEYDRGPLIMEDLRALPGDPIVVVDSAPPDPVAAASIHVVWLMSSPAVRRARPEQRHPEGVPPRYLRESAADRAAESHGATVITDNLDVEQTVAEVERVFACRLAEGPVAATVTRRQELLRYANQAIIAQCRGWLAHQPDPGVQLAAQVFDCECARPECAALVELAVEAAETAVSAGPPTITTAGHQRAFPSETRSGAATIR